MWPMSSSILTFSWMWLFILACCLLQLHARDSSNPPARDDFTNIHIHTVSKCPKGTFQKDLYCVTQCGPGMYGDTQYGKCYLCSKACRTCLDGPFNDRCSSCYKPYFLIGETCTKECNEFQWKQGPPSRKIRLVGDATRFQGRVEVFRGNTWGTICDDGWDVNDAHVVCRELMLGKALSAVTRGMLGKGDDSQPIWLSNLQCTGNETRLEACSHSPLGKHNCSHFEDVGVICSGPDSTRRCVDTCGPGFYAIPNSRDCGVCSSNCLTCANSSDSCLTCERSLFLKGNKCVSECGEGLFGSSGGGTCKKCDIKCRTCSGSPSKCTGCPDDRYLSNGTCVIGCGKVQVGLKRRIRLVGKRSSSYEGRVEVLQYNGLWKTVCDESWDFREASVICRELGLGRAIRATRGASFGQGTVPIWYDTLSCTGSEKSIFDCPTTKVLWSRRCFHSKDAGVICAGPQTGQPSTNLCINQCPEGFYKSDNDVCFPCASSCAACIGYSTRCTKCKAPKFLKGTSCINKCGGSQYGDTPSRECKDCDKKCVTCADGVDGTNCTSCSEPHALKDGKCTSSCQPNLFRYKGKCIQDCPMGYFKYVANFTCVLCPKQCFACEFDASKNVPKCTLCNPPSVFDGTRCTTNCTGGKVSVPIMNATGTTTVRLVNGSDYLEGRVEILHDGIWGTICDDGWDFMESKVLCRQLNLGSPVSKSLSHIAKGTGKIWLDDMFCIGRETALEKCRHRTWGQTNCNHNEDVIVRCSGPGIRKCQDNCPAGFYARNSVCQLCDSSCALCSGNATNCIKCADGYFKNDSTCVKNCGIGRYLHKAKKECLPCSAKCETCYGSPNNCTSCVQPLYRKGSDCLKDCGSWHKPAVTHGIRLVKGKTSLEGRVEILYNNQWGTICDDGWDLNDAAVVCRMLGLGNATHAFSLAKFGPGSGKTWLDDVACTGTENTLAKCGHRGWGIENCEHTEDASVRCSGPDNSRDCIKSCSDGYYTGPNNTCGRCSPDCRLCSVFPDNCTSCAVTEYLNRSSVRNTCVQDCGDGFYADTSTKTCKPCSPTCFACFGTPNNCTSCQSSTLLDTDTRTCGKDCSGKSIISGIEDIRLSGTNKTLNGRLEIKYNGEWGTVCDDNFDIKDAHVACRQLKLGKALGFKARAFYGPGKGKILLDDLQCIGTEKKLFNCKMNSGGVGNNNCGHSEDVGVTCSGPDTSKRCISKCPDGFFEQGGYCRRCSQSCKTCIGSADKCTSCFAPQFLSFVSCVDKCPLGQYGSTKNNLRKCLLCNPNCQTCLDGETDAYCRTCEQGKVLKGSKCVASCGAMQSVAELLPSRPSRPSVRLVNDKDNNKQQGRVEVFHDGVWGTVCDDNWDLRDANVVCRELGFGKALKAPRHAEFGKGRGMIWMDNVDCYGYESSLTQCRQHGWGVNNCDLSHGEDASVVCDNSTIEDVSNNYCREVLSVSCKDNNPCFPSVTCVDLAVLTNSEKKESICLECPDKYIGDGKICRAVSSTKPVFNNKPPSNITLTSGSVLRITCRSSSSVRPVINALINDWQKDGKDLNKDDIGSKTRITVSTGQLVIRNVEQSDSGNYTCRLVNTAGSSEATTEVIINEFPRIRDISPAIVTKGSTAYITCYVSSHPPANITWSKKGKKLTSSRYISFPANFTLAIKDVRDEDEGEYTCTAANELGVVNATVNLTAGLPPIFEVTPKDYMTTIGEPKTLKCLAKGEPKPTITWKREGEVITPDDYHVFREGALVIKYVNTSDLGLYTCIARNSQKIIAAFSSLVLIGKPLIDVPPENRSVLTGANVSFTCRALGSPLPTITWKRNFKVAQIKSGKTNLVQDTLTVSSVKTEDAGIITCEASNEYGTVAKSAFLSVDGQSGVIMLSSTNPKSEGLSTGAITAIIVILLVILLVIIGVVLYRYYSGRGGTPTVFRYELGDDSGKPDRLTALKFKIRSGSKNAHEPMQAFDDSKPFVDHDGL